MEERTINAPVEVDLGGGKLNLVFDMDAMISMEESGLAVGDLQTKMEFAPFGTLRQLIWFGAKRLQPDLKIADIGPMIDMRHMDRLAKNVTAALESQLPEQKENPPAPPLVQ
jgi:hypothetical protein